MSQPPKSDAEHELPPAGMSRRRALHCMGWAGAGVLWTMSGGVACSSLLGSRVNPATGGFSFAQISDSHIGFNKDPNHDSAGTLQAAINQIRALPQRPGLLIHTGDVSQLSRSDQFDMAEQIIKGAGLDTHYVPGEHDVLVDDGAEFFQRFAKDSGGKGWYSFDQGGVHFVALVNVLNLRPGGLGYLGPEQLGWLEQDLRGCSASTPLVIFTHMPLWTLYPAWGWGTDDSAQALAYLKRFGSVTVLNGHIHQVMQKVEGNVTFHTARSTAFPQPAPGTAPSAGPMKVPADKLRTMLGTANVTFKQGEQRVAIIDTPLQS